MRATILHNEPDGSMIVRNMRNVNREHANEIDNGVDSPASVPQMAQLSVSRGLLKPVHGKLVTKTKDRIKKKIKQNGVHQHGEALLYNFQNAGIFRQVKLCVPTMKGFIVLKLDDIILCEAERNYTVIHLRHKNPVTVSRTLLEYEKILGDTNFLRVHRTFLINLRHVTEYHKGEGGVAIMSNGAEIEISRRKKEQFISRIKACSRY